jgi:hypothetical protein
LSHAYFCLFAHCCDGHQKRVICGIQNLTRGSSPEVVPRADLFKPNKYSHLWREKSW